MLSDDGAAAVTTKEDTLIKPDDTGKPEGTPGRPPHTPGTPENPGKPEGTPGTGPTPKPEPRDDDDDLPGDEP